MRAFQVNSYTDQPRINEIAVPEPNEGEVTIKIEACGLNFADLLMRKGTYQDTPALPFTLGMEVCGTISDVGHGVVGLTIGDRVAGCEAFGGERHQARHEG